ncbi:GNAT family N-acetyltransferase [Streptomyces sp. RS10V-4]|uniref:GNAT family N-acetyltransferase n=1 Tax=Streptomyces rhizoryzae TaxID=2932493 RepID=UPI00200402C1|nr:GNAT family N-acetyltransferase [Streptomyces rhizoryzae]MCK7625232.1 GNAT family N-acetyltransferase [Streptomyces rhizoryzae]
MIIRRAAHQDLPGFLRLAGQVEQWFGPMVGEPGFRDAVAGHIKRAEALVAASDTPPAAPDLLGGLLFGPHPAGSPGPARHRVNWLVVAEGCRGRGVGRALLADAVRRFVTRPGTLEVVTFGSDHPGADASGARRFYEALGFTPAEAAPPGPEGGSRQRYRKVCRPDAA